MTIPDPEREYDDAALAAPHADYEPSPLFPSVMASERYLRRPMSTADEVWEARWLARIESLVALDPVVRAHVEANEQGAVSSAPRSCPLCRRYAEIEIRAAAEVTWPGTRLAWRDTAYEVTRKGADDPVVFCCARCARAADDDMSVAEIDVTDSGPLTCELCGAPVAPGPCP